MASSIYRDAIIVDGCFVMQEVTNRLYLGGHMRPDQFYQLKYGNQAYQKEFKRSQQQIIEDSGLKDQYDIRNGSMLFDITLHWIIQQKLCDIKQSSRLYKNLSKLVALRNQVAHPSGQDDDDVDEKLTILGELYDDILVALEDETNADLYIVKQEVVNQISKRKKQAMIEFASLCDSSNSYNHVAPQLTSRDAPRSYNQVAPVYTTSSFDSDWGALSQYRHTSSRTTTVAKNDEEDLGNFGKAMAGLGIGGAIGIGLGLLGAALTDDAKQERQKMKQGGQTQTKKEDEKPEYQGWGATGAAIGAGIGLIGALASMDFSNDKRKK